MAGYNSQIQSQVSIIRLILQSHLQHVRQAQAKCSWLVHKMAVSGTAGWAVPVRHSWNVETSLQHWLLLAPAFSIWAGGLEDKCNCRFQLPLKSSNWLPSYTDCICYCSKLVLRELLRLLAMLDALRTWFCNFTVITSHCCLLREATLALAQRLGATEFAAREAEAMAAARKESHKLSKGPDRTSKIAVTYCAVHDVYTTLYYIQLRIDHRIILE